MVSGVAGNYEVWLESGDGVRTRYDSLREYDATTYVHVPDTTKADASISIVADSPANSAAPVIEEFRIESASARVTLQLLSAIGQTTSREAVRDWLQQAERVDFDALDEGLRRDFLFSASLASIQFGDGRLWKSLAPHVDDATDHSKLSIRAALSRSEFASARGLAEARRNMIVRGDRAGELLWYENESYLALTEMLDGHEPAMIEAAGERLIRALATARDLEEPGLNAKLLSRLWLQQSFRNQHDQAEKTARLQTAAAERSTDASLRFEAYSNLAASLLNRGVIAESQYYLRKALDQGQRYGGGDDVSVMLSNLALTYRRMGRLSQAKYYYEVARDEARAAGSRHNEVFAELNLGAVRRDLGEPAQALAMHEQNLAYYEASDPYFALLAQIQIARDYVALGAYDRARSFAGTARENPVARPAQQIDAELVLLTIALETGDSKAQEEVTSRLLARFEKSPSYFPIKQLRTYSLLVDDYGARSMPDKVEDVARRAITLIDFVRSSLTGTYFTDEWSQFSSDFIDAYVGALYRHPHPARFDGLFELLERYHSLDRSLDQGADDPVELDTELQRRWDEALDSHYRALLVRDSEPEVERALTIAKVQMDTYLALLPWQAPSQSTRQVLSAPEVQSRMQPGDWFIRYYLSDRAAFALVMTNKERVVRSLSGDEIESVYARFEESLMTTSRVDRDLLTRLSVLLPEWEQAPKRVIVVPDGVLHRIPFAALGLKDAIEPVGWRAAVLRTNSASDFYASSEDGTKIAVDEIAVFADPVFDLQDISHHNAESLKDWAASLPRLPHTAREAGFLQAAFSEVPVHLMMGNDATAEALLSADARRASVLHIATHGYFDDRTPDLVGIATSSTSRAVGDGFLNLSEMLRYRFDNDLVVVSGCETLLGENHAGRGMNSVSRGLMLKGLDSDTKCNMRFDPPV